MNPLTLPIITASVLGLGVALPWSTAIAQTAKDLVGTWNAVSATVEQGGNKTDTFGPNPRGTLVFAHFGTYSVSEDHKTLIFRIESSTFPNWSGVEQKRPLTVTGDEMKYMVPTASAG
jgi:hypothetical protein